MPQKVLAAASGDQHRQHWKGGGQRHAACHCEYGQLKLRGVVLPWLPLPFVALAGSHVLKLFAWRALLFGTSFLRSPLRWWVRPLLVYADG